MTRVQAILLCMIVYGGLASLSLWFEPPRLMFVLGQTTIVAPVLLALYLRRYTDTPDAAPSVSHEEKK